MENNVLIQTQVGIMSGIFYMIDAVIRIRLKQVCRGLIGIGLIRIIFLAGLFVFILFYLFLQTSTYPNSFYVTGVTLLIALLVQTKRQDKVFLQASFYHYRLVCYAEYLLITLPVTVLMVYHAQWISVLILLPVLYCITCLDFKPKQRTLNTRIQQWIPSACFEWKGGIRKTLLILLPLWIAGLCTPFTLWTVPIVLFIIGIIPFSFYEQGEPYQMITAFEMGTKRFLFHKISMLILLYSVLAIPLMVAFLAFHYEHWYIPVAEYFIFLSLYIYLITTKYAFYEPNIKSPAAQTFQAIGALGGLIPVFLPVVWLLTIRFYFRSKETLNLYLNDYN